MKSVPFKKGLLKLSKNTYAYLQPDGGWGLSNAGLVVGKESSLLVDTLYDLKLTSQMLDEMSSVLPSGKTIDYLFNTHANGDHWFGNSLLKGARIISTEACLREMKELPPKKMNLLMRLSFLLGKGGKYARESFRRFHYGNIKPLFPQKTFSGEMEIELGDIGVKLIELGPAHTKGDAVAFLPDRKIVFAADLLFINSTPLVWGFPLSNMIRACEYLLDLDAHTFVPGHGPVTDKSGVEEVKRYCEFIDKQGRTVLSENCSLVEAAKRIDLKQYASWAHQERHVANLYCVYREMFPGKKPLGPISVFGLMEEFRRKE
ncbi:MAG: MBL fold metallo-hydrolase [Chitinispirillaceae bacterium]